jgi:hypothetical protein
MTDAWFHRLADIPEIGYRPSTDVDRAALPGWDSEPDVRMYNSGIDDQMHPLLDWGEREFSNDEWESLNSPVSEYLQATFLRKRVSTKTVMQRVREGLELPGTPEDYSYALSRTLDLLWERRQEEAGLWDEFERLALVSVRLAWLYRDERAAAVAREYGTSEYRRPRAVPLLVMMYRTEGYLTDALTLLEEEQRRFPDVETQDLDDIRSRIEIIDAEVAS